MNTVSHPKPLAQPAPTLKPSTSLLIETLIVLAATLVLSLALPQAKSLIALLPVVYLLVERLARHRPWAQLGLRREGFRAALAANWALILLVAVVVQAAVVLIARALWPALLAHITGRLPLFDRGSTAPFIILVLISTFLEELSFRGLFQERLGWFMPPLAANLIVSIPFALLHWSAGALAIVAVDVGLVALDSVLYGLIYDRGHNVVVSWIAHCLADLAAVVLLLVL